MSKVIVGMVFCEMLHRCYIDFTWNLPYGNSYETLMRYIVTDNEDIFFHYHYLIVATKEVLSLGGVKERHTGTERKPKSITYYIKEETDGDKR